ncbi:MAG TPA: toll/interleukin-1 receptor domain-containing protein [Terriglobia bacterium]|nr:toll/interleukin-1 receptor domain-containing protein [Terriglobia bacterium]
MGFKVFLSYSLDAAEQALAWRLQTLAAAHGVEMYVPPRGPLAPQQSASSIAIHNAIDRADCVLAIITAKASANVERELRYALTKQKLVIPIVRSDLAGHPLLAQFPQVFTFSPWDNPGQVEGGIVEFLKEKKISKEQQQAIGALAAVGIGLLLLFSLSEK